MATLALKLLCCHTDTGREQVSRPPEILYPGRDAVLTTLHISTFDLDHLLMEMNGDLDRLRGLARTLRDDLPGFLAYLKKHVAESEFEWAADWSGRLGATLSNFLALEAGRRAYRVKAAAAARRPQDLSRELDALDQEARSLLRDLDRLLDLPL